MIPIKIAYNEVEEIFPVDRVILILENKTKTYKTGF